MTQEQPAAGDFGLGPKPSTGTGVALPSPLPVAPAGFRAVRRGQVEKVELTEKKRPQGKAKPGAVAGGLRYEKKVLARLEGLLASSPYELLTEPCIQYTLARLGRRVCWPDALVRGPSSTAPVVAVEIKHIHTGEAWWELQRRYVPLLRKLHKRVFPLEIVREYRTTVKLPEIVSVLPLERIVDQIIEGRLAPFTYYIGLFNPKLQ